MLMKRASNHRDLLFKGGLHGTAAHALTADFINGKILAQQLFGKNAAGSSTIYREFNKLKPLCDTAVCKWTFTKDRASKKYRINASEISKAISQAGFILSDKAARDLETLIDLYRYHFSITDYNKRLPLFISLNQLLITYLSNRFLVTRHVANTDQLKKEVKQAIGKNNYTNFLALHKKAKVARFHSEVEEKLENIKSLQYEHPDISLSHDEIGTLRKYYAKIVGVIITKDIKLHKRLNISSLSNWQMNALDHLLISFEGLYEIAGVFEEIMRKLTATGDIKTLGGYTPATAIINLALGAEMSMDNCKL